MSDSRDHDRVIAFHEAGHVVVRYALNLEFSSATIEETEEYLGQVQGIAPRWLVPGAEYHDQFDDYATRTVIATLAGPEAEVFASGRAGLLANRDEDSVNELLDRLGRTEDYEEFRQVAQNLIVEPDIRRGIEAIAAALLEHRTLQSDGIIDILEKVEVNKQLPPIEEDEEAEW